MWSDIAVQCAPISLRPLLCLKVSSLRPLVVLVRMVEDDDDYGAMVEGY
jgi:hypothetical protein